MAERDFYQVLGVPRTATEAEIRKAYRNLARKFHPDKNPDDKQAEDRFKEIGRAREVLQDKKKRALYDEFGEAGLREGFNPDAYRQYRSYQGGGASPFGGGGGRGPSIEDLFSGMRGGGFQDFSGGETLEDLFGRAGRRQQRAAPKPDLVSELMLGFAEALSGGERKLELRMPNSGAVRELKVRIPPGVKDGGQIRLRGQGLDGGDLVLRIQVEAHPFFQREGDDLLLSLPISVGEAFFGAKIAVPTPSGEVTLTIPKGVKSGGKLRLRGKGAPKAQGEAGDLIVTLQIRLPEPTDGSDTQPEAIAKLISELETHYATSPRAGVKL